MKQIRKGGWSSFILRAPESCFEPGTFSLHTPYSSSILRLFLRRRFSPLLIAINHIQSAQSSLVASRIRPSATPRAFQFSTRKKKKQKTCFLSQILGACVCAFAPRDNFLLCWIFSYSRGLRALGSRLCIQNFPFVLSHILSRNLPALAL